MKKTYVKPYLAVETFQLDAAIASSCSSEGRTPLNYGVDSCTSFEEAPGLGYFGAACAKGGLDVTISGGDDNDGFCYHGPIVDVGALFMNS